MSHPNSNDNNSKKQQTNNSYSSSFALPPPPPPPARSRVPRRVVSDTSTTLAGAASIPPSARAAAGAVPASSYSAASVPAPSFGNAANDHAGAAPSYSSSYSAAAAALPSSATASSSYATAASQSYSSAPVAEATLYYQQQQQQQQQVHQRRTTTTESQLGQASALYPTAAASPYAATAGGGGYASSLPLPPSPAAAGHHPSGGTLFRPALTTIPATTSYPSNISSCKPHTAPLVSSPYDSPVALAWLLVCIWILLGGAGGTSTTSNDEDANTMHIVTGVVVLVLYALDLANFRQASLMSSWLAVLFLTIVQAAMPTSAINNPFQLLLWTAISLMVWIASASRWTMALKWLQTNRALLQRLQATTDSLLPPLAATLLTMRATAYLQDAQSVETAALAAPHVFALVLAVAILTLLVVGFGTAAAADKDSTTSTVPPVVAWVHACLLLVTPLAMHLSTCFHRILSKYASLDDWYDLTLVVTVPWLWLYAIGMLTMGKSTSSSTLSSPYALLRRRRLLSLVSAAFFVLTLLVLQQRYIVAWTHSFSYRFLGSSGNNNSSMIMGFWSSVYWVLSTVLFLLTASLWGKTDAVGQSYFGEYHDDLVQLLLAGGGLFLGKAIGLPWSFTPLPILTVLGATLWLATRMLRYLVIFLFVLHAAGLVIFTYRFTGIHHTMTLPITRMTFRGDGGGLELSLLHFGMLVGAASIVVGLVAGLAVRSSGGVAARLLVRFDAAGLLLVVYTLLLLVLEITLVRRPIPTKELAGVEFEADEIEEEETLYSPALAMLTSMLIVIVALAMQRAQIMSARVSGLVLSLALGKAVAFYIDLGTVSTATTSSSATSVNTQEMDTILMHALIASTLSVVLFAPSVIFLHPVYMKHVSRRGRSSRPTSIIAGLPRGALRVVVFYAFILLPVALIVSIPYVLYPLARVLVDQYNDDYMTSSSMPVLELAGTTIALWGLACMNFLNHYLPDGGAEGFKKLSALVFLAGTSLFFAAPMLGAADVNQAVATNPYAAMSSLSRRLVMQGRSRTGGWGLLSAALATLLAIAGPLELKERQSTTTSRRDKFLLFRTMIFSLMFGSGVAWFIVMQSMSEAPIQALVVVSIACLAEAFIGTIAGVMGYFMELDNFAEAQQLNLVYCFASTILLPLVWFIQMFVSEPLHWFGAGGWLSTFLVVNGLSSLSICIAVGNRTTKNIHTRGLANLMCILSWLSFIIILYGRYGVAGLDMNHDAKLFYGVPISVVGTLAVSPLLFLLEGEASARRSLTKVSAAKSKSSDSVDWMSVPLKNLGRSNSWAPSFYGSVVVYLCASLYAIFIRGSGLIELVGMSGIPLTASSIPRVPKGVKRGQFDLLETLAWMSVTQDHAIASAARLANSSIWTTSNIMKPLLHMGGVIALLPTLHLVYRRFWLNKPASVTTILLTLPLNTMPFVVCRGIPSLQAAAALIVMMGVIQLTIARHSNQESMMRI